MCGSRTGSDPVFTTYSISNVFTTYVFYVCGRGPATYVGKRRHMSLATYVARSDICRTSTYVDVFRHMSLGARYVAPSEICRSRRDMSLGARYVARPEICRLVARYVDCSEISREGNRDMSHASAAASMEPLPAASGGHGSRPWMNCVRYGAVAPAWRL